MEVCNSPVHSLSLREIMDEEYARQLTQQPSVDSLSPSADIDALPQSSVAESSADGALDDLDLTPEERAFLFGAAETQSVEAGVAEESEAAAEACAPSVDEDLLYALRLQEELDREASAAVMEREQGMSKVAVVYAEREAAAAAAAADAMESAAPRRYGADDYEEAVEDDLADEEEVDEEEEAAIAMCEVPLEMIGVQLDPSVRKPFGRACSEHFLKQKAGSITKHDAVLCGFMNAKQLERFNLTATGDLMSDRSPVRLNNKVYNHMKQHCAQEGGRMARLHGKSDRSTQEAVMDQRTRMLLYKLLNRGAFDEMSGVVSTGKEANVYCASKEGEGDMAVKVYRTTLNEFKDREAYLVGTTGRRCRSGVRGKVIRAWAEKELGNLARLERAGIPCPRGISVKENVLLMSFIGRAGVAAPRLKDATLSNDRLHKLYLQIIRNMRAMYTKARLVHADLSPYNVLVHHGEAYIIDLAQAVDNDSPNALTFLRKDCDCMTSFFHRAGVETVLSVRQLFDYVTDSSITLENEDEYLERLQQMVVKRGAVALEELRDEVFLNSFIPRTLSDVHDPIGEYESIVGGGDGPPVFHLGVTGMRSDLSGTRDTPSLLEGELSGTLSEVSATLSSNTDTMTDEAADEAEVDMDAERVLFEEDARRERAVGEEEADEEADEGEEDEEDEEGEDEEGGSEEAGRGRGAKRGAGMSREEARRARKQAKKEFKMQKRMRRAQKHGRVLPSE